jgi:uncharacterized membrane protein YgcG
MSARSVLTVFGLALVGLLAAASIGYGSYLVSRDSVGLPVTKLQDPQQLTPRPRQRARTPTVPTSTAEDRRREDRRATTGEDRPRELGDDNSGRGSSGSGSGSGGSGSSGGGSGGGGRGGDDD